MGDSCRDLTTAVVTALMVIQQDETTVDILHEDLFTNTASFDGEEGSEDEEQGAATVCHEDEEAVQGIQLQARARGESSEGKSKTFEGEFRWKSYDNDASNSPVCIHIYVVCYVNRDSVVCA